jgi:homoserine dehydrogenase
LFVSFDNAEDLPTEDFEWIEEFYQNDKRQYIIGAIQVRKLKATAWLGNKNISAIMCPNGIIENIELRKIKKRSLQLAGINF